MAKKYPEKVGLKIGFDATLAHRIYAGSDIFLMPSKSEPCGLAQMVALRYGTVPIVRETGGLNDTITDVSVEGGNGYVFDNYNAHEMLGILNYAKRTYYDNKKSWNSMVKRAMKADFSWRNSAKEYIDVYNRL